MMTIKKTYYAFMLATATFAQLGADSYLDYFTPEVSCNNAVVSAVTAREVARDLYRAYKAHVLTNDTVTDKIQALMSIKSNEYFGHSYAYSKSVKFFKDYEWTQALIKDMSANNLRSFFITRAIFRLMSDYGVVIVADNMYRFAPAQLADIYAKLMNMVPERARPVINEIVQFTFKEVVIALIGYKIEPHVMNFIFNKD